MLDMIWQSKIIPQEEEEIIHWIKIFLSCPNYEIFYSAFFEVTNNLAS